MSEILFQANKKTIVRIFTLAGVSQMIASLSFSSLLYNKTKEEAMEREREEKNQQMKKMQNHFEEENSNNIMEESTNPPGQPIEIKQKPPSKIKEIFSFMLGPSIGLTFLSAAMIFSRRTVIRLEARNQGKVLDFYRYNMFATKEIQESVRVGDISHGKVSNEFASFKIKDQNMMGYYMMDFRSNVDIAEKGKLKRLLEK